MRLYVKLQIPDFGAELMGQEVDETFYELMADLMISGPTASTSST